MLRDKKDQEQGKKKDLFESFNREAEKHSQSEIQDFGDFNHDVYSSQSQETTRKGQRPMFEKTTNEIESAEWNAFIGKGSEFVGKLSFDGIIKVDGKVEGEITTTGKLIIGEGAKVNAEIRVGSVEVSGEVNGNIYASETIILKTPGKLYGDITTPCLVVEKGVVFHGSCSMDTEKKKFTNEKKLESALSTALVSTGSDEEII